MSIRDILNQSEELDRDVPEDVPEPENPEVGPQPEETTEAAEEPTEDVEFSQAQTPEVQEDGDQSIPEVDIDEVQPESVEQEEADQQGDDSSNEIPQSEDVDAPDNEIPEASQETAEPDDIPEVSEEAESIPQSEMDISVDEVQPVTITQNEVATGAPELPKSEMPEDSGVSMSAGASSPEYSDSPSPQSASPSQEPEGFGTESGDQYSQFSSKVLDNRQSQADDIVKSLSEEFRPMFENSIERNKQAARDFMHKMIVEQQLLGDD